MAKTVFAFLVGIDSYEAPIRPLHGCVNDIHEIEILLRHRVTANGDRFEPLVLTNAAATRRAIIDGFRQHLGQAKGDDVAVFYYSGHGSQQKSPPEFWHLEPDRLDETLVCHDSRRVESWDLADKELAQLIADVAEKKAHVVVILDCCHSGSGTRNADDTGIRRVPTDLRERPLSTFLEGLQEAPTRSGEAEKESGWVALPEGRHILLAACRADEEAKEYSLGGKQRGVFSHFLVETLGNAGGAITYRELFKRVNALVRSHAALQSPQIEPTDHAMFDENFLGGAAGMRGQAFTLSHDATGWTVDAGTIHGIPQPAGDETTIFAIFPRLSAPEQWRDINAALGTARARQVEPHRSAVEVAFEKGAPSEAEVYRAVLAALPLPPLDVQFEGDATGLDLVSVALSKAGDTGGPSLLVRESRRENAELRLVALEGRSYRIVRPADGRQLVADVEGFTPEGAAKAVAHLEHIARWTRISEMRNPASELDNKVRFEIYTVWGDAARDAKPVDGVSLRMAYTLDAAGKWRAPQFKVKVRNDSDRTLYVSLLGLTQTFAVDTSLLPSGCVRLEPGEEAWGRNGKAIPTTVPKKLWEAGVVEVRDVLKLIASTEECDATLLEQGDLDYPAAKNAERATRSAGIGMKSTLGRLMRRVQTRALGDEFEEDEKLALWTTQEFTFTTLRPRESTPLGRDADAQLYPGVTLLSHPALKASARLTTAPTASRDVAGGLVLPPLLRDDPVVSQPFLLSSSRGGAPGLSVLELHDVENHASVTPEQPLRIQIAQSLGPGEHLLAVTYDGDFYLPIGRGVAKDGGVEVLLDALPEPRNTRSLFSAVRIFFQKITSQYFGTQYDYPLLAAFEPGGDDGGQVTFDVAAVKAKVTKATRIVLYIHGIIGETRGMAASSIGVAGPPPIPGLRERYDLILTFDYENLHTPIEENARLLKQRLADVGLGFQHGKTLHIIAHSMGGLLSRWFIEREGGNEIVQHLVMLGTSNGGSPWPAIEDWAITALSLGLNGLAPIPWVGNILGSLVSAVEKIDVALDQMQPSSEFLKNLHESPDPKIPYTIIAGNTSLVSQGSAEKEKARRNLLDRLKSLNLLHLATAPAFFGEPNDIAVSVANICRQPGGRVPAARVREVGCDHLTYFSAEAGLQVLADLLPPREKS